jgi:hypothetical protein
VNESGAKRPYRFVRYLEQHGYEARVITASPQEGAPVWRDVSLVTGNERSGRTTRIASRIAAGLQRILPCNDQLSWASYAAAEAVRLAAAMEPAAIISTSPPLACQWAAFETKLRLGLPWIADLRDPIYGNPHRARALSKPYDSLLERLVVRHADALIANTDAAADALRRRHPGAAHKIHLLWNGYDPAEPLEALPKPPRSYRVLLHPGSIYAGRHPGALLASLERLIGSGRLNPSAVRLRLIGWMDFTQPWVSSSDFQSLVARGCLEYVNEVVPEPDAIREMGEADYLLLLDGNQTGAALQVPAKIFQYIRIGRPVFALTANGSPAERILRQSGIPFAAASQDDSPERIDQALSELFDTPPDAYPASAWFEQQFDARLQTGRLAAILRSIAPSALHEDR